MKRLVDEARARRIPAMHAVSASNNIAIRRLADAIGMRHARDPDDPTQVIYHAALEPQDKRPGRELAPHIGIVSTLPGSG